MTVGHSYPPSPPFHPLLPLSLRPPALRLPHIPSPPPPSPPPKCVQTVTTRPPSQRQCRRPVASPRLIGRHHRVLAWDKYPPHHGCQVSQLISPSTLTTHQHMRRCTNTQCSASVPQVHKHHSHPPALPLHPISTPIPRLAPPCQSCRHSWALAKSGARMASTPRHSSQTASHQVRVSRTRLTSSPASSLLAHAATRQPLSPFRCRHARGPEHLTGGWRRFLPITRDLVLPASQQRPEEGRLPSPGHRE